MRILVSIAYFLFLWNVIYGAVVQVGPYGDFKNLNDALLTVVDGDTIIVEQGTYHEHGLIVRKSITILGNEFPEIIGDGKHGIISIEADNVVIKGITLRRVDHNYIKDLAALRVIESKHFLIENVRIYDSFFGIYLEHSSNGSVLNNEIIGDAVKEISSGNAIHAWYCKNLKIEGNHVEKHRDGIYFEFVDNSSITENISVSNLRYGLHFMFSDQDQYSKNEFRNNGAGVAVMFSKNIIMDDNLFEKNWGRSSYGLLLKEIYDAEITNNRFVQNTIGIFVEGSTRINYFRNDFRNNGWAIKVAGGCLDNRVEKNNFFSNTLDLVMTTSNESNSFDGNFWSEYSGYDLDKNGIGDVPYRPVKLFSYILDRVPESIILLRSSFIDLVNFAEKVSPVFTPDNVKDFKPSMNPF